MSRPLLLDACVTINLLAAAPIDHVAQESGYTFLITRQAAGEVGYLREVKYGQVAVVHVGRIEHAAMIHGESPRPGQ